MSETISKAKTTESEWNGQPKTISKSNSQVGIHTKKDVNSYTQAVEKGIEKADYKEYPVNKTSFSKIKYD